MAAFAQNYPKDTVSEVKRIIENWRNNSLDKAAGA
jgi:hypothetical protein